MELAEAKVLFDKVLTEDGFDAQDRKDIWDCMTDRAKEIITSLSPDQLEQRFKRTNKLYLSRRGREGA